MADGGGAFGAEKDGHVGGSSVPSAERSRRQVRPRLVGQIGRDGRSRFNKSKDGTLQAPEPPPLFPYREGEGMPDLSKLLRHSDCLTHCPPASSDLPASAAASGDAGGDAGGGKVGPGVRSRQLWGTDVYTDDSDIVAVLMHVGYITPVSVPPPASIAELRATIRVLPPQPSYRSSSRNSMRSRAWGSGKGTCSYAVESCRIIKHDGTSIDLEASSARTPPVGPTLVPAAVERTMTTRASSSVRNAHRHQRFVQEVTLQYNLCNEPWLKYSMAIIADHGLKRPQYTSARLKRAEVLYLETATHRFELSYEPLSARKSDGAAAAGDGGDADAGAAGVVREGGVDAGGDKEEQGGGAGERREREKGAADEGEGAEGPKGAKEKPSEGGSESKAADGEGKEHPEAPPHPPSKAHTSTAAAAANAANANSPNTNSPSAAPSTAAAAATAVGTAAGGNLSGSKRPFSLFSSPPGVLGNSSTNPETQWVLPQSALAQVHGKGKGPRDTYRWTQCVPPLPLDQLRSHGCPLPAAFTKILESGLAWDEVQWAPGGCGCGACITPWVWVRGLHHPVVRAHFMPRKSFSSRCYAFYTRYT
ncbi:unnamed protein product [Closterium sp. Yama58-4]|nr:unnamed protein product [Closterium sp. Yama58-4]